MKKIEFNEMEKYRAIVCLCILMTCATVTAGVACIPRERDALLALKNASSVEFNTWNWKGLNCCEWHGIQCSKYTSHVIQLRFSNENDVTYINKWFLYLRRGADLPRLSPVLFQLKHLEYLDLSNNYFQGALPRELFGLKKLGHLDLSYNFFEGEIPKDVGSLHSLTYLNLNSAGFQGRIPWQVGNLSQLQFLDLSDEAWPMKKSSLGWTENLRQLKYLRISWVLLNMASEELEASISPLYNLHHLDLSSCLVSAHIPNSIKNLTSLSVLELGGNDFTSIIPSWLENMTSLVSLGLNYNFLRGPFPLGLSVLPRLENLGLTLNQLSGDISQILCSQWPHLTSFSLSKSSVTGSMLPCIGNLSALQTLDLGYNLLMGEIPPSVAQLSSMRHLDLSNNHLNGIIPILNGLLLPLERLDLSSNNLEGNFSLEVFQSSNNLNYLDLSYNKFIVRVKPEWIPSFNLRTLNLASCNIEGVIPLFLSTQYTLSNLDLSMNTLVGSIPPWLFGDFPDLHYLNLSHNSLQGQLPFTLNISSFSRLDLHNNLLNGYLPLPSMSSKNLELLDLSQNKFEGVIPKRIGRFIPFITFLSISENKLINGGIHSSIGFLRWLEVLDLSKNKLSSEIPSSLTNCTSLTRLNLEKNNLKGEIPAQIGILKYLKTLHLNGNRLKGRLPSSLQNFLAW